jgi:hypothetical protein
MELWHVVFPYGQTLVGNQIGSLEYSVLNCLSIIGIILGIGLVAYFGFLKKGI